MAFLDIERIINQPNVDSRFKLVHLAALRARELNNPTDETIFSDLKQGEKVTSKALSDIVHNRIRFAEIEENELIDNNIEDEDKYENI